MPADALASAMMDTVHHAFTVAEPAWSTGFSSLGVKRRALARYSTFRRQASAGTMVCSRKVRLGSLKIMLDCRLYKD